MPITELDVSALTALQKLLCGGKPYLSSLKLGNKPSLTTLNCIECPALYELDISGCTSLALDNADNFSHDDELYLITDDDSRYAPRFYGRALMLSGTLGMYFYMKLPTNPNANTTADDFYSNSSMTFTITQGTKKTAETKTVGFNEADTIYITEDGEDVTLYGFRCEITSIQMDDDITAVFNYTDNETQKSVKPLPEGDTDNTYTVSGYLNKIIDSMSGGVPIYEDEVRELAKNIKDYGHYAQIALDAAHDTWAVGEDHNMTNKASEGEGITDGGNDSKYEENGDYKEYPDASTYDPAVNAGDSGLTVKGYTLDLDANTTLEIEFTPAEGVTITAAKFADNIANWDGGACTFEGNYVNIADIPAHELATARTIEITTGNGTLTISNLSALSYVQKILAANDDAQTAFNNEYGEEYYTKLKNAVTALYHYYVKTNAYRSNADVYNKYNN